MLWWILQMEAERCWWGRNLGRHWPLIDRLEIGGCPKDDSRSDGEKLRQVFSQVVHTSAHTSLMISHNIQTSFYQSWSKVWLLQFPSAAQGLISFANVNTLHDQTLQSIATPPVVSPPTQPRPANHFAVTENIVWERWVWDEAPTWYRNKKPKILHNCSAKKTSLIQTFFFLWNYNKDYPCSYVCIDGLMSRRRFGWCRSS